MYGENGEVEYGGDMKMPTGLIGLWKINEVITSQVFRQNIGKT